MSDTAGRPRGGPSVAVASAVLLAVVVLLAAGSVALGVPLWRAQQKDAIRAQAMHAARQESVNLFTFDYKSIDKSVANVLAGATGDFHDQYAKDSSTFKKATTDNQISSEAQVLDSGVVSADTDSVTVLVVVDYTVHLKPPAPAQLRHSRMQLEMSKVDGRWRARSLTFVT